MFYTIGFGDEEQKFVYGLFGVQHTGSTISQREHIYISTLQCFFSDSASRFEYHKEEISQRDGKKAFSSLFVAYWSSIDQFEEFKVQSNVQTFWDSLPDDAGVWQEIIIASTNRFQFGTNSQVQTGASSIFGLVESDKAGFWGSYRARIPDSKTDALATPLIPVPATSRYDLPRYKRLESFSSTGEYPTEDAVHGRVEVDQYPDNVCFVRESQVRKGIEELEQRIWQERMLHHASSWCDHLASQGDQSGVLAFRITASPGNGDDDKPILLTNSREDDGMPNEEYRPSDIHMAAETNQFGYFVDLGYLERAARSHRGHLRLRDEMNKAYCPMGSLEDGKSLFWVEMCILKRGDFKGMYIGCREGTGLMRFRNWKE